MNKFNSISLCPMLILSACGAGGEVGDECSSDDDCADGLECHFHDEHGESDTGDDDDHDDHDHGEEEVGECEAHEDE